jgi:hypothetical protein
MLENYRVVNVKTDEIYENILSIDEHRKKVKVIGEDNIVPIELDLKDVEFNEYVNIKTENDEKIYVNDVVELLTDYGPVKVYILKEDLFSKIRLAVTGFVNIEKYLTKVQEKDGSTYYKLNNSKKISVKQHDFTPDDIADLINGVPEDEMPDISGRTDEELDKAEQLSLYFTYFGDEPEYIKQESISFMSFLMPKIEFFPEGMFVYESYIYDFFNAMLGQLNFINTERFIGHDREISFSKYKSVDYPEQSVEIKISHDGEFIYTMIDNFGKDTHKNMPLEIAEDDEEYRIMEIGPNVVELVKSIRKIYEWVENIDHK